MVKPTSECADSTRNSRNVGADWPAAAAARDATSTPRARARMIISGSVVKQHDLTSAAALAGLLVHADADAIRLSHPVQHGLSRHGERQLPAVELSGGHSDDFLANHGERDSQ